MIHICLCPILYMHVHFDFDFLKIIIKALSIMYKNLSWFSITLVLRHCKFYFLPCIFYSNYSLSNMKFEGQQISIHRLTIALKLCPISQVGISNLVPNFDFSVMKSLSNENKKVMPSFEGTTWLTEPSLWS